MSEKEEIDLGSVHIRREVLGRIIEKTIRDVEGVELAKRGIAGSLMAFFAKKDYPSLSIKVDENNEVSIGVTITVDFGVNIPDMARKLQDLIRIDLEKSVEITLKDINIDVQDIRRGRK